MQCINPLKAGFDKSGKLTFSSKYLDKNLEAFSFECRKCLPCRLNIGREKGIRALHEAKTHDRNIFLTLTYSDEHLDSSRLNYSHFQDFIRALRDKQGHEPENKITYMVTGEYGEKTKRPHWHALLFNYRPADEKSFRTTDRGDSIYKSANLELLWPFGFHEYGEITLDSAGYVGRYAAKKLVHGKDQDHEFHPLHKTSSRRAIGRTWIEKHWEHTFRNGFIVLNGQKMKIPRYYVDWLKKHKPDEWRRYVTEVRPKIHELVFEKQKHEEEIYLRTQAEFDENSIGARPEKRSHVKETILKQKFKRLQSTLKL